MTTLVRLIICTDRGPTECAVTANASVEEEGVPDIGTSIPIEFLPTLKASYPVVACISCSDRLEVIVRGDDFTVQRLKREGWPVVKDFHKNRPYP